MACVRKLYGSTPRLSNLIHLAINKGKKLLLFGCCICHGCCVIWLHRGLEHGCRNWLTKKGQKVGSIIMGEPVLLAGLAFWTGGRACMSFFEVRTKNVRGFKFLLIVGAPSSPGVNP